MRTRERPPSVIWVLTDQLRAQATGYAGDPNSSTPNLDRLAAEGVEFTRAAATAPLCTPARAALLTGRRPEATGVLGHQWPLDPSVSTVADAFNAHGFSTCYIGKWHLDGKRPELAGTEFTEQEARERIVPADRRGGFRWWWGYENSNQPFSCLLHSAPEHVPAGARPIRERDGAVQFELPGYETDVLTDLMIDWLEHREETEPFFAVLSVQPPHDPYVAPAEAMRIAPAQIEHRRNVPPIPRIRDRAARDLAGYYGAITQLDLNVGRIRDCLTRIGRDHDTYLVFLSDHGDMHGSHGQFRKTSPWEESIRIPLLIGGPSRSTRRGVETLVTHTDIAPTTLGLAGIEPPEPMDGLDLSALVTGWSSDPPVRDVLVEIPVPTSDHASVDRPWRALLTHEGWKYVELDSTPWLLFDLNEDPLELANHAHDPEYASVRSEMVERMRQLEADLPTRTS
ncbi:sulfatase [Agromyces mediolanus]|uniref:sulfatase family protein n=1 Tax=Agromyces mediolanus TaxID=41986 RepID=UPI00203B82A1|nr:sulfatase [Agromyces mediolanus]MCM3658177.1 sulfatase [Agromyces mediolanus]